MIRDMRRLVREWLEAEEAGRPDQADSAFASVAEALPHRRPSAEFAAAVMARVAMGTPSVVNWWASWGVRAGVAASVVTLGIGLGTWSSRSMLFAAIATAQAFVWGIDQVVAGGAVWIETALTLWGSAAHAAVVLGRLLVAPGPALLVGVNLAVAVCAFAALHRLLASQED